MKEHIEENVAETLVEGEAYAKIIKDDDGNFHVVDFDGTVGPICKFCDADDKTIVLTKTNPTASGSTARRQTRRFPRKVS